MKRTHSEFRKNSKREIEHWA